MAFPAADAASLSTHAARVLVIKIKTAQSFRGQELAAKKDVQSKGPQEQGYGYGAAQGRFGPAAPWALCVRSTKTWAVRWGVCAAAREGGVEQLLSCVPPICSHPQVESTTCPLCVEEMDLTDLSFMPCPCG